MEDMASHLRTESVAEGTDFVTFLQVEYARRQSKNPRYSLRAFARSLEVDQSLLSKILARKRKISEQMIFKMSLALQLQEHEAQSFILNGNKQRIVSSYHRLADEELAIISDWHTLALLELSQTADFVGNAEWIAKRLEITEDQARFSISKLMHLKLIEIDSSGSWKILTPATKCVDQKLSSLARKKLQKQYLQKASVAIDNTPLERRENMSMSIAVHPNAVGEVKRRIADFNENLRSYLNTFENPSEVYQVLLAFYPLTQTTPNEEAV